MQFELAYPLYSLMFFETNILNCIQIINYSLNVAKPLTYCLEIFLQFVL